MGSTSKKGLCSNVLNDPLGFNVICHFLFGAQIMIRRLQKLSFNQPMIKVCHQGKIVHYY